MLPAVGEHGVKSRVAWCPFCQVVGRQIVFIVLEQLLNAASRDIEQFQFHLHRCHPVGRPLDNVLLSRAGRLHHLVDGAVAMGGKEAPGESEGHLVEDDGLLIEPEVLPVGLLAQDGL